MTIRDLYEHALTELNKIEAPSLLLEDYNYFLNKAVQQYINKVYNRYDINQQSSDDLRVLKATTKLDVTKEVIGKIANKDKFVYIATLPIDYMHILNCIVDFKVKQNFKCYRIGDHIQFAARRLTADMSAGILHNVYMKPSYKRPYFYINNVNLPWIADSNSNTIPTGTSNYDSAFVSDATTYNPNPATNDLVDSKKPASTRVANASEVRIEIRIGEDDTVFEPSTLYVDYIKAPMFINLTYDDITSTVDNTRAFEFPDYVCFEVINEFVKLLMENASDPRLQSNFAVNQTVADPTVKPSSSQSRDKS